MADVINLPIKRIHGQVVTGTMLTTMDDIESNVTPPYLRDYETWKLYAKTRAAVEYANILKSNMKYLDNSKVKRWHVQKSNLNGWRENKIDKRLIYNSHESLLKDYEELKPHSRPSTPEQELPRSNADLKVEKNYILDTKGRIRSPVNITAKRLMKQTMREFNRPVEPPATPYCSPRHQMGIQYEAPKPVDYDVITNFPMGVARWARRYEGTICSNAHEQNLGKYCDVLGPYSCKKCIEVTNRKIITEIQKESFPEFEFSVTNIVAPQLSIAMQKGDRLMSREKATRITRSVSDVQTKSILKFPTIKKIDPKSFKRAGIENLWCKRSKANQEAGEERLNTAPATIHRNSSVRYERSSRGRPARNIPRVSIDTES